MISLQPSVVTGNTGRGGLGPPNAIHNANDIPLINPDNAPCKIINF